jgi:hypothetical protein
VVTGAAGHTQKTHSSHEKSQLDQRRSLIVQGITLLLCFPVFPETTTTSLSKRIYNDLKKKQLIFTLKYFFIQFI